LAGKLLYACDAATGNPRSPSDDRRVDGTSSMGVHGGRAQAAATGDVSGSVKHLGELWRRSVMKTTIGQNT